VGLLCAMTGRVALQAVATSLPVVATDRAVAREAQKPTAAPPPVATTGRVTSMAAQRRGATPLHIWPGETTVRRALAVVVSSAAVARAAVVSLTPLLAATMTARLEPVAGRSAVVLAAGTLSNLT